MRRYKIVTDGDCSYIEAETPQKALEKMYVNYDMQIELASKDNATHAVVLMNSERRSINYYTINNKKLNRKPKPDGYIEPMPKNSFKKLLENLRLKVE